MIPTDPATSGTEGAGIRGELAAGAADLLRRAFAETTLREMIEGPDLLALWPHLAEAGWFELLLPDDRGGLGLGIRDALGLFTLAGEHGLPGPLATHVVAVPMLAGVEDSARGGVADRLSGAATGDLLVAFADAAVDLDPFRAAPPPVLDHDGLHGRVDLVPFGAEAGEIVVCATDAAGAEVVVLVAADAPGVDVGPVASMDPSTTYAALDLAVDPDDLLVVAGPGTAADLLRRTRTGLRLALAAQLTGLASRLATMATDYAGDRTQFDRPIGSFQAVKHLLADIAVRVTTLRNLCATAVEGTDDDELELLSFVAKARAAEASRQVALDALQVHGGIGFTWEHDLHLYLKQVHALCGLYGDERELAGVLGAHLVAHGIDAAADHAVLPPRDVNTGR